jgi:voltage-gated potassium channel
LHEIIFEADTPAGRAFDVALFAAIGLSIVVVMAESVGSLAPRWGHFLWVTEWALTLLFTVEYGLRIYCVGNPRHYIFSFFGIVDLLSILPTYLSVIHPRSTSLLVIRSLRLLRIFRVLKLAQYLSEARVLLNSMRRSSAKIVVFFMFMLIVVVILGAAMYVAEAEVEGSYFTSIPKGVYWAIVTVTTVGYGDVVPRSVGGQALAAVAMIIGYSIIVVPTGIVSADLVISSQKRVSTQACPACSLEGHDFDARFCKYCGGQL